MRNVDEWLCNLYLDIRKVQLFDFRYQEERIEFAVPKRWMKRLNEQKRRTEEVQKYIEKGEEVPEVLRQSEKQVSRVMEGEEYDDEDASDYSSESELGIEDELDYEGIEE
jgi:hypothetical protein